jgi:hypothetical protein
VIRILTIMSLAALASGCVYPTHLQYDYGRAMQQAMNAQADLSRPSAANAAFPLSGTSGLELRMRVQEVATDQESAKPEAVKNIGVD